MNLTTKQLAALDCIATQDPQERGRADLRTIVSLLNKQLVVRLEPCYPEHVCFLRFYEITEAGIEALYWRPRPSRNYRLTEQGKAWIEAATL